MCIYVYIYIYMYIYIYICIEREGTYETCDYPGITPNLPTHMYGFQRVWLKHNLDLKAWNSQALMTYPGKFDTSNLSRDNFSRDP